MPRRTTAPARARTVLVPVLPARDAVHFPLLVNTLHVVREPSLRAVRKSMEDDRLVLVLSQRDMSLDDPGLNDLHDVGTLSEALQALPLPDTSLRVVLRGIRRSKVRRMVAKSGTFFAEIEDLDEEPADTVESDAIMRVCVETFGRVVGMNKQIPPEAMSSVVHVDRPGHLADAIAHHLPLKPLDKQRLLEEAREVERLNQILLHLKREEQILDLNARIHERVERELGETQREFYLREQLKIIQSELQEHEDRVGETEEYRQRIETAGMPELAYEKAMSELRRLDRTPANSPEGMVLRNYLDCMVELPWSLLTEDRLDVNHAKQLLEEQHYGLDKVKTRILDFLAVRQLKGSLRGPILCFVGPPGVGKTSIARSIADAMGRRFVRLSLGGVRDEADIRGHRRTYVGSAAGRIIQGLRQCGSKNPVIVLDEIDKLGDDWRGDPTSALLEALDPEQNPTFRDHYLEAPFDLSSVMFIATANLLERIPAPLRDRMEVIPFPSYTDEERAMIAKEFLVPRMLEEHGLSAETLHLDDSAIQAVVTEFTREAGVRNLEREIATVCRKAARAIAEGASTEVSVDEATLAEYLGRPKYKRLGSDIQDAVGAATGLVVSEVGGDVVSIEVSLMQPSSARPELQLTGNMGEVMKESALAALTFVRANAISIGVPSTFKFDVHIHIPQGAIPKDGPSAGVTICTALASAATGRAVRGDVAMTGEITLRGNVLPVGGIRDKVLAAYRAGMRTVILPKENESDLDEVPAKVREALEIHLLDDMHSVLAVALQPDPREAAVQYSHDPFSN